MMIEVAVCPNCGSESVSWWPGYALCYRCNWNGSPYDLIDVERDENDDAIEGDHNFTMLPEPTSPPPFGFTGPTPVGVTDTRDGSVRT